MSIHFKFKAAKDFDTLSIDGPFITVGDLKDKIVQYKHLGSASDFELVILDPKTGDGTFSSLTHIASPVFAILSGSFAAIPRIYWRFKFDSQELKRHHKEGSSCTTKVSGTKYNVSISRMYDKLRNSCSWHIFPLFSTNF